MWLAILYFIIILFVYEIFVKVLKLKFSGIVSWRSNAIFILLNRIPRFELSIKYLNKCFITKLCLFISLAFPLYNLLIVNVISSRNPIEA